MDKKSESVTTVIFDMWGQTCITTFEGETELDPETWIERCYERGFMIPRGMIKPGGEMVRYGHKEIAEMTAKQ